MRRPTNETDTPRCKACGYVLESIDSRRCPECGQAFDPADPATPRQDRSRVRRGLVFGLTTAAVLSGTYWALMFRSQHFGLSVGGILGGCIVVLMFSLPFIAAVCVVHLLRDEPAGRRMRRCFVSILVIFALAVGLPEAWCGAQDLSFYYRTRNSPTPQSEGRWWPMGNHGIDYVPTPNGPGAWGAHC